MKRAANFFLRCGVFLIGAAALAALTLVIAAGALLKLADWREVAATVVRVESGYQLSLRERPAVTFFPALTLTSAAAALQYPGAADAATAVAFDRFAFTLPWADLWRNRGTAAVVTIDGLQLNLAWPALIGGEGDAARTDFSIAAPGFGGRLPTVAPFIRRITVSGGELRLATTAAGMVTISDANFTVTAAGDTVTVDSLTAAIQAAGIRGTVAASAAADFTSDAAADIINTASGTATLTAAGGIALPGLSGALGGIGGRPAAGDYRLSATVELRGGRAINRDLRMSGDWFTAAGDGSVALSGGAIDYLLRVRLPGGLSVPLRIGGTLGAPTYAVDAVDLLRQLVE